MKAIYYDKKLDFNSAMKEESDFEDFVEKPEDAVGQVRAMMETLDYSTALLFGGSGKPTLFYRKDSDNNITCCSARDEGLAA